MNNLSILFCPLYVTVYKYLYTCTLYSVQLFLPGDTFYTDIFLELRSSDGGGAILGIHPPYLPSKIHGDN